MAQDLAGFEPTTSQSQDSTVLSWENVNMKQNTRTFYKGL